jgi:hypothetical protein
VPDLRGKGGLSQGLVRLVREERVNTAHHKERSGGNSPHRLLGADLAIREGRDDSSSAKHIDYGQPWRRTATAGASGWVSLRLRSYRWQSMARRPGGTYESGCSRRDPTYCGKRSSRCRDARNDGRPFAHHLEPI